MTQSCNESTKSYSLVTSILSMLTFLYAFLNSLTPTFIASTCHKHTEW